MVKKCLLLVVVVIMLLNTYYQLLMRYHLHIGLVSLLTYQRQTSGPLAVQFNSDGMKFYVFGSAKLHEYSMTTAYNLSTASFVSSIDVDGASNIMLSHTGSHMYFANGNFIRSVSIRWHSTCSSSAGIIR